MDLTLALWHGLESAAVVLSLLAVRMAITRNWYNFVMSIVGCSLYMVVFYKAQLYFNFFLQLLFIGQSMYGMLHWQPDDTKEQRTPIMQLNLAQALATMFCIVGLSWIGWLAIAQYQAGPAGWRMTADAVTTGISLVAQWLMIRRVLESWLLWVLVDVLYVGLFIATGMYLSAGLYLVFCFMASMGYIEWRKQLSTAQA